jgi:hypothetical protein
VKHQAEKNIAKGIAAAAKQRKKPDLSANDSFWF